MNYSSYQLTHPDFTELEIPEYTAYKLRLVTPDIKYAKKSLDWVSDKEVGKYMGADFSRVSLTGEEERLKEILNNTDAFNWIIECDGEAVGNINLSEIRESSEEFGFRAGKLNYLIGDKKLWGKGITSAAVGKVLNWAFDIAKFEVIKSRVLPQNKGSAAVLLKTGFEEYDREDYDGPDVGVPTWYVAYKLTKDDWRNAVLALSVNFLV